MYEAKLELGASLFSEKVLVETIMTSMNTGQGIIFLEYSLNMRLFPWQNEEYCSDSSFHYIYQAVIFFH